jgi:hypothetical protein
MNAIWLLLKPFAHWIVGGLGVVTLIGGFAYQQQNIGWDKREVHARVEGTKIHARAQQKAKAARSNPDLPCRDC